MNLENYNIVMPGRIVEYFPEEQVATIRISMDRTFDTSTSSSKKVARGLLEDVPVFTPSGGGWAITFPIKIGDTCLLMFSQFGYDHWLFEDKDDAGLRTDGQPMPWTRRMFSLADGFAMVGFNTLPRAISAYNAIDSEWRNEDAGQRITLKEGGDIEINTPTEVIVTAPTTTINGNLDVVGNVTATGTGTWTGDLTADGVSVSTHEHAGDGGTGSGPTTGPPL